MKADRIDRTLKNPRWWLLLPVMPVYAVPAVVVGSLQWTGHGLAWLGSQLEREFLDRMAPSLRRLMRWANEGQRDE